MKCKHNQGRTANMALNNCENVDNKVVCGGVQEHC